uniref:Large ribosomal subunit protein bL32m n=1 Tax=Eubosmina coregoni TaxID=186181 RepID=A0A4Y7LQN1_9CRUS|nr:EOG090X0IGM [Eubosmina coregoni]SVE70172.1 EOG090X0IGM [Eubosmina coregoni]
MNLVNKPGGLYSPPAADDYCASPVDIVIKNGELYSSIEILNSVLRGVPTGRRSAEKRSMRKFGAANWHNKLILPKQLQVCVSCGHHHEKHRLCPNCYAKVKTETSAMQDKMIEELGLNPIEKEVVILYKGEKQEHSDEFFQGKRIVEMDTPRPSWFCKNLLQKSGSISEASGNEVTAIKPHNLG